MYITVLVNLNVCKANSLVGDIIKALGPLEDDPAAVFDFSCSLCNIGSRNAAVLPLPVLAIALFMK